MTIAYAFAVVIGAITYVLLDRTDIALSDDDAIEFDEFQPLNTER